MFQKRHYERMAEEVRECMVDRPEKIMVVMFLCSVFADDNSKFDRKRFIKACGMIEDETTM
jgi:hypothetical protein